MGKGKTSIGKGKTDLDTRHMKCSVQLNVDKNKNEHER